MIDIFNEIGFINPNGGTERTVKGEQISVNNASEQGSVVSMTEYVDPSQNLNGQTRPYPEMGGSNILPGADNVKNWVISGSGDVVNFYPYNMSSSSPWNLKKLKTTLAPIQDLHGYDSPWVGGAGVNILPPMVDGTYTGNGVTAVVTDGVATLSGTTTTSGNALIIPLASPITVPDGTIYYHMLNSVANAQIAPTIENSQNTSQNISYALSPANRISGGITAKTGQTYDRVRFYLANGVTISGTYAPMICKDATVRPYSPYSNYCPISGWDGVNGYVDGKNRLPFPYSETSKTASGITFTVGSDGSVNVSGTSTAVVSLALASNAPNNYAGMIITGSPSGSSAADAAIAVQYWNGGSFSSADFETGNGLTLIASDTVNILVRVASGVTVNKTFYPMIRASGTDATYEPYNGTTYPVNLSDTAGTVYGGTLDVVSGELTVTDANIASYNGETLPSTWISDRDVYASGTTPTTGAQVVYKLATPLTYQLTPTQIAMIVGDNYIWTDCGTITDASYYVSLTSATVYLRANSTGEILNTSKISSKFFSNTNRTLSFEHTASAALTVDIILAGTSGTASDNVWTRTRWGYLAQGVSLARTSTWTKYTLPATAFNEAKLTQGSGDVNSFYIQIVPSGKVDLRRFELENGSTATAWTPSANHAALLNTSNLYLYKRATMTASGTSYSKSLGRSVYYGKLEFKSGTLTVLGSVVTLNSTNQTWQSQTSGSNMRFYASISGMKSSTDASETLCTDFASTTSTSYTSPWGYYRISGTSIYISNYYYTQASGTKFFDTLADFKAWLDARETAGSPVQLLYPLATPQTYSLGTTTINLLSGMNYFDSGTSNRRIVEGTFIEPYLGLKRPNDFAIQREDIYAGEYTTCTGAAKADRIGWKYSDMEIVFDELTESELQFLIGMNGAVTFIFADSDGQHQENVIRAGFTNTPTRLTLPDGQAIWKNAGLSIRFIDAHN